jgi:rhodanese-related sulfurtransferase
VFLPPLQFLQQIRAHFELDSRLIVGSADKSRRALAAATVLEAEGFSHVLAMRGGVKAWAMEELPMDSDLGDMS